MCQFDSRISIQNVKVEKDEEVICQLSGRSTVWSTCSSGWHQYSMKRDADSSFGSFWRSPLCWLPSGIRQRLRMVWLFIVFMESLSDSKSRQSTRFLRPIFKLLASRIREFFFAFPRTVLSHEQLTVFIKHFVLPYSSWTKEVAVCLL